MRSKRVLRFYCDFCKKSGQSSYHIRKHERGCTNNPGRVCGLCEHSQLDQKPLDELRAALESGGLDALRKLSDNCPACILTTLRQTVGKIRREDFVEGPDSWPLFNFENELKAFWAEQNDLKAKESQYC